MKIVAITQRIDHWPDRKETRDAIDQQLVRWVMTCGFMPVLVPNTFDSDQLLYQWLETLCVSGLLLSGGNDIGEYSQRDKQEKWLLDWAANHSIPVLGICRGMQAMAGYHGSNLIAVEHHVATQHRVSGEINLEVNSFHRYAIADTPTDWHVLAQSDDNVIEAILHKSLPWEAWMFHPERDAIFIPELQKRFCNLMDSHC